MTSRGAISTGAAVICAGPWSRKLARKLGVRVPLGVERAYGVDLPDAVIAPSCPLLLAQRIVDVARLAFPQLRTAGATTWMRQRPSMPDSLPVIGRTPGVHNAYLAFGHGHKGLGTAASPGS